LENYIELKHVSDKNTILKNVIDFENVKYDFVMCMFSFKQGNPPFFENEEEATRTNEKTNCQGTFNELITEGGEVSFIKKIIDDSIQFKENISWYTSMMGKKVNQYNNMKVKFKIYKKLFTRFFQNIL
jgi:23S rRNA (adenine1618-N6)-methyltransferase